MFGEGCYQYPSNMEVDFNAFGSLSSLIRLSDAQFRTMLELVARDVVRYSAAQAARRPEGPAFDGEQVDTLRDLLVQLEAGLFR